MLGVDKVGKLMKRGNWTPAALNPEYWFDFSDIDTLFQNTDKTNAVTANGQRVNSIANKGSESGFLYASSATTGGQYDTGQSDSNGEPVVAIASGYPGRYRISVSITEPWTILAVVKRPTGGSSSCYIRFNTAVTNSYWWNSGGVNDYFTYVSGGVYHATDGNPSALAFLMPANKEGEIYENGGDDLTDLTYSGTTGLGSMYFNEYNSGLFAPAGTWWGQTLFLGRNPSPAELANWFAWSAAKYGVTLT